MTVRETMTKALPDSLALLKREHDEEKVMMEELKGEIECLKRASSTEFEEVHKRVEDIFLSIESGLLLHIRKEEEGLFSIIGGDEEEMGGRAPPVMEHYELEEIAREVHEIIYALGNNLLSMDKRQETVARLSERFGFFCEFLTHHIEVEVEEKELFPIVMETMSEGELSRAFERMKFIERWVSSAYKKT
jgi:hemerythrin-like domain-containing protein